MLSSSLHFMLKISKTISPQKLIDYDWITLYFFVCGATFFDFCEKMPTPHPNLGKSLVTDLINQI